MEIDARLDALKRLKEAGQITPDEHDALRSQALRQLIEGSGPKTNEHGPDLRVTSADRLGRNPDQGVAFHPSSPDMRVAAGGFNPAEPSLSSLDDASLFHQFATSAYTHRIIGTKHIKYLERWQSMFEASEQSIKRLRWHQSWNWAALCFTFYWLLYRRLYGKGLLVMAVCAAAYFIDPRVFAATMFVTNITIAVFANSLLFDGTFARWRLHVRSNPGPAWVTMDEARGGNWLAAIGGVVLFLVVTEVGTILEFLDLVND